MFKQNIHTKDLDFDHQYMGFAAGREGGAWTYYQATVLFETGSDAVYCVRIDLMKIAKVTSIKEAAEFFEIEEKSFDGPNPLAGGAGSSADYPVPVRRPFNKDDYVNIPKSTKAPNIPGGVRLPQSTSSLEKRLSKLEQQIEDNEDKLDDVIFLLRTRDEIF